MPKTFPGLILLLQATSAATGLAAQAPALLVNGSFEDGPPAGRFVNVKAGSPVIKGWVVTGEAVDFIGTLWPGSQGAHSIDLDGSARSSITPRYAKGGVAQTFPTTPGARYKVTFDLAGNPFSPPRIKPMRVLAAGQSEDFRFDVTGKSPARMGWIPESWTFTANAATTTLELVSLTVPPVTGWGAAIDNVTVALVADQEVKVTENEKEIEVTVGAEVLFATGKYEVRPAATAALSRVAEVIKSHPGLPIVIEGHTDSIGTVASNQVLSERRAKSVQEWLTAKGGVPADHITTKGYGRGKPAASNLTEEGRQKNRRVEIRILKTAASPKP
jgi:choice-of-anchor C domain-containing protein